MGYMYPDGSEDDWDGMMLSMRTFVGALSFLLKDYEGVCVNLPSENELIPVTKKAVVYASNKQIHIITEDTDPSIKELEVGQLLWVNK